jgi:hypothetical protein
MSSNNQFQSFVQSFGLQFSPQPCFFVPFFFFSFFLSFFFLFFSRLISDTITQTTHPFFPRRAQWRGSNTGGEKKKRKKEKKPKPNAHIESLPQPGILAPVLIPPDLPVDGAAQPGPGHRDDDGTSPHAALLPRERPLPGHPERGPGRPRAPRRGPARGGAGICQPWRRQPRRRDDEAPGEAEGRLGWGRGRE